MWIKSFSLAEMREIIALVDDNQKESLRRKLESFIETDKARKYEIFLTELASYASEIPDEKIQPLLQAIYDLSDRIPSDKHIRYFTDQNAHFRGAHASYKLIERFEESKRFKMLKEIFENTISISMLAFEASILIDPNGI